jgi:hypothetical protein
MAEEGKKNLTATLHAMLADKEQPHLEQAMQAALSNRQALDQILAGIVAKEDAYRFNCFQVLYRLSEELPDVLYPEWDYFVGLLDSDNSYHRSIAARLIANLAQADTQNRLEGIFDRYFDLLDDEKIITARQFAQHVGRIARAKPHLQTRIVERLLAVDTTHHEKGRKDLLKGDVIAAFDECLTAGSPDQARVLAFVEQQLASSSPKTRKAAQAFLQRHKE